MQQPRASYTYPEGMTEKFCAGVPIDNATPRLVSPLLRGKSVIGTAMGPGTEHAHRAVRAIANKRSAARGIETDERMKRARARNEE